MFWKQLGSAALLSGLALGRGSKVQNNTPTATIDAGLVIGTTTSLPAATVTVNKFLGIPFAVSPPKRFEPPRPAENFSEPWNATQWGHSCIQQFNYPEIVRAFTMAIFAGNPRPNESEDCLYLNVYAPADGKKGKPVLFWIYGGGLQFGNAGQNVYDGSSFASYQDVIVVTTNYRVNAFGFSNSPELPITQRNVGFLDQRMALDWVQKNIEAFGGDPKKVTIFGESAGASSVDRLVTTLSRNPPFWGAITQSGQASVSSRANTGGPSAWSTLVNSLNCSSAISQLACVQAADAFLIKNITEHGALNFSPVTDNVTQLATPLLALRAARNTSTVPLMTGTNGQEGRVFLLNQIANTSSALDTFINATFPQSDALRQAVKAAYPLGQNGLNTPYDVASQINTEFSFQCPAAIVAHASINATIPTWRYYFNATFANLQLPPSLGLPQLRAFHATEIPLVFGTYTNSFGGGGNITKEEAELSSFMQRAWASFAKTPSLGPGWQKLNARGGVGGLACLGCGGEGGGDGDYTGVVGIDESEVDERCRLYEPIYKNISVPAF